MTCELVHAWSDQGVDGDAGFVTVQRTHAMSDMLSERLEGWSGIDLAHGSTVVAHRHAEVSDAWWSVVSRISTTLGHLPNRPVRTSHHIALNPRDAPAVGPVALARSGPFIEQWSGASTTPDRGPRIDVTRPMPSAAPEVDPGWIEIIAEHVQCAAPVHLLLPEQVDGVAVLEAVELALADHDPWTMTFVCGPATAGLDVLVTCRCPHPGDQRVVLDLATSPAAAAPSPLDASGPGPDATAGSTQPVVLAPRARGPWTLLVVALLVGIAVLVTWLVLGGTS